MSVRDAMSAWTAECKYWRGQQNRVNSSTYAGSQDQSYSPPSGSDHEAGASCYEYGLVQTCALLDRDFVLSDSS